MNRWLQRGIVLRLLSLVLAFILWFMVNEPTLPFAIDRDTSTITGVQVEPRYDASKFRIMKMTHKVDLVLIGAKETLNRLPAYHAYVDLSQLPAGKHKAVPVQIEGIPANVKAHPNPATIPVEIAEKTARNVAISVTTVGQLPSGYKLLPLTYEPTFVRVSGIKQEVDQVSGISAFVQLANIHQTVNKTIPLVINGSSTHKPAVRLSTNKVKVTIPIERLGLVVPLAIVIDKPPPTGFKVVSTTASSAFVTIYGPPQAIASITSYKGIHLDLSKITTDTTITQMVTINPPVEKVTPNKVEIYVKMIRTPIS
jgi:YbbR domain-containing protein